MEKEKKSISTEWLQVGILFWLEVGECMCMRLACMLILLKKIIVCSKK